MPKTRHRAGYSSDSNDDVPLVGPNCLGDKIKAKRKAECISDSDDDVPVFANKVTARRKAECISDSNDGTSRSLAEAHAFITSSNLSAARADRVLETFCNVRRFEPIARLQGN